MDTVQTIAHAAYALASCLPGSTVEMVAAAILTCPETAIQAEITRRVPHHQHRALALTFIEQWKSQPQHVDAKVAAAALQTAAIALQCHRDSQSVELAWTGPDNDQIPLRRTEQAILQVLDSAQTRITLVSFAVYRIPNIGKALVRAAQRGVKLTVIVETPDRIEGQGEYNTLQALGQEVKACSEVYFWPYENRPLGENAKAGILHVKCAVADGNWLFLSSANLTRQAFTINMELGMLVRGGTMPIRVEQQFDWLIKNGHLKRI